MLQNMFETFLLLAYFNIALLSVTVANYAVSASYLGRETRLSRRRMERKRSELIEKLRGLKKETEIKDVKKKIKESEAEEDRLRTRIVLLSWLGAVILPSIFFVGSFASAVIGMNSEALLPNGSTFLQQQAMIFSLGAISIGFMVLLYVIRTIDSAARSIPVPEFEVFFLTGLKTERCKSKEQKVVTFCIKNEGEDIAENLSIFVCFPPQFGVHKNPPQSYYVCKQSAFTPTPNYNAAISDAGTLHVNAILEIPILLTMPEEQDTYEIPIEIFEKKIGMHTDKLVIEVAE